MIYDQIKFSTKYECISNEIKIALDFLRKEKLHKLPIGRINIRENDIFCLVSEYTTKPISECSLESHKKYIDIQSIAHGKEKIGCLLLNNQSIIRSYDDANDYTLYKGNPNLLNMGLGMFAIFFPNDLHMPGIGPIKNKVKKVVIKVKV